MVEGGFGTLADHVKVYRQANYIYISNRLNHRLEQREIQERREIGTGFVVKMLRAAVDEDDKGLQDRWAELMASAFDPRSGAVSKSHVAALETMMPQDVRVLDVLVRRNVNLFAPATEALQAKLLGLIIRETGLSETSLLGAIGNLQHLGMLGTSNLTINAFSYGLWGLCTPPDAIAVEDPELDSEWEILTRAAQARREKGGIDALFHDL